MSDAFETLSRHIADTRAGAVRLVSLRLSKSQSRLANESHHFSKFVGNFLNTEVKPPFKYRQVSSTAFAINGQCNADYFDSYVIDLHDRLMEFLFGTEREHDYQVLFFAGSDVDVATFITEPEEDAIQRSKAFQKAVTTRQATPAPTVSDTGIDRMTGKRPLLYRGILACPPRVLLAYAITPAANPNYPMGDDIDLNRYLKFRSHDAIDFTIRLFKKASYFLQTASREMRSVVLLVPISYRSLLSQHDRHEFMAVMADHPDWVRDQMFLSVFDTPDQPSTTAVQRFASEFSPKFRTMDWQTTRPDITLSTFLGSRLHSMTFDLHGTKSNREKRLRSFLDRTSELKSLKIRAAVTGVDTRKELQLCLDARIAYVSGNAVTAPLPGPAPAQKISLSDLPIREPTVIGAADDIEAA